MAALNPVYTVGHSTRTVAEFVALLQAGNVQLVVDIRSFPRSRTNPQFNLDALPDALAPWQLDSASLPQLGGRRGKSHSVPPDVNGFWINASFHNYADYALSAEFNQGFKSLESLSQERSCAIMCSEALWWRCHRRIVADYLLYRGYPVFHLMGKADVKPAAINGAAIARGGALVYPAQKSVCSTEREETRA